MGSDCESVLMAWSRVMERETNSDSRQFIEQEPGPRGSPQVPQGPGPLDVAQSAVAPTPNGENCFCSLVALQDGQAGMVEPCTSSSNRW